MTSIGNWDMRGGALWLDREQWGVIVDALIEHRGSADARKKVNSESTSNVRADACLDLIGQINAAAKHDHGTDYSAPVAKVCSCGDDSSWMGVDTQQDGPEKVWRCDTCQGIVPLEISARTYLP